MKLLTYSYEGRQQVGVLSPCGKRVYPVKALGFDYNDMNSLIEGMSQSDMQKLRERMKEGTDKEIPLDQVKIEAPIPHPRQDVIGIGRNYMDIHAELSRYNNEAANTERTYPIFFARHINRIVEDGGMIDSHSDFVSTMDYECELAVIIGKDAYRVSKEEVPQYIFGYSILNDITAHELSRHKQNFFMKSLDDTCPMGPWIVTADEITFPPDLRLQFSVNGELRQDGRTSQMIFGIDELVSELSKGMTVKAGTIIASGSPAGTGIGKEPPVYLRPGDVMRCELEGIGVMTNTMK